MVASLSVTVYDGAVWRDIECEWAQISRRIATSSAVFRAPDIGLTERNHLRPGRETRIILTVDGVNIRFNGYIEKPKFICDTPGNVDLLVTCVGLELGATLFWIGSRVYNSGEAYTAIIDDLWSTFWGSINRTKIVVDAKALPSGETLTYQYKNLAVATSDLVSRLDNYVWWLEWDGTTQYLRLEPKGHTTSGKTFTEADIRGEWELEPRVSDVRNFIRVVGGVGGGPDPGSAPGSTALWPVAGIAQDVTSETRYGTRPLVIFESQLETNDQCVDRAEGELARRGWPTWSGRFKVYDYALDPNQKVTFQIATVGQNGIDYGDDFLVERTVDIYERGFATREVTFTEIVPPSV